MKLYYAPSSPYVRKVMAAAITLDLDRQIALIPVKPFESPAELLAVNPLSRIPCLITSDGAALFDSPVICEYLDSLDGPAVLFPPAGRARWRALKQQAMADGILDAAVARRMESTKPREAARDAFMARQHAAVTRTLAVLEADVPHCTIDIGTISIACALGYLDFRFAHEPWRDAHPRLAAWCAAFAENPGIARTTPRDAA
jgi:glutathione S-transferase